MGEAYRSLRPLLHRSVRADLVPLMRNTDTTVLGTYTNAFGLWRVPVGYGRTNRGYSLGHYTANNNTSLTNNSPLTWIINCYVGYRGSMNVVLNPIPCGGNDISSMSISRIYSTPIFNPSTTSSRNLGDAIAYDAVNDVQYNAMLDNFSLYVARGASGLSLTNPKTLSAITVNVPQYNPMLFQLAFAPVRDLNVYTSNLVPDALRVDVMFDINAARSNVRPCPYVEVFYAAGVDFQTFFFLCTPRIFTYNYAPPP